MMRKIFTLIVLSFSLLSASILSYEELRKKPKSIAKDYYIYRLLSETKNVTAIQAALLKSEISRSNAKLEAEFAKRLGAVKAPENECGKITVENIKDKSDKCILSVMSPSFALNFDDQTKLELSKRLRSLGDFTPNWLQALSGDNISAALQKAGAKEFLFVFNSMSKEYRIEHFDSALSASVVKELEAEAAYGKFVRNVILGAPYLQNLPHSLVRENPSSGLTHETLFLLGLNAAKFHENDIALDLFLRAKHKAYFKLDSDKALFWAYLVSKEEEFLRQLSESYDTNIYSLYAQNLLGEFGENITFVTAENKKPKEPFDMQDPFAWREFLDKVQKMSPEEMNEIAPRYDSEETLPLYAFLLERIAKYRHQFFIIPFEKHLQNFSNERKAMILSLARQESGFVTSAVSTSYALGMMQFMPFLAKDTAEKLKLKKFDIDDMFRPDIAYRFADVHLDYLEKSLYHPLFIAYAYNGGIGFTKRMLESGLFSEGEYEPFMSMELVAYDESREYGKKVLANYIIYSKHFQKEMDIKALFEVLTQPSQTDRFRK